MWWPVLQSAFCQYNNEDEQYRPDLCQLEGCKMRFSSCTLLVSPVVVCHTLGRENRSVSNALVYLLYADKLLLLHCLLQTVRQDSFPWIVLSFCLIGGEEPFMSPAKKTVRNH